MSSAEWALAGRRTTSGTESALMHSGRSPVFASSHPFITLFGDSEKKVLGQRNADLWYFLEDALWLLWFVSQDLYPRVDWRPAHIASLPYGCDIGRPVIR